MFAKAGVQVAQDTVELIVRQDRDSPAFGGGSNRVITLTQRIGDAVRIGKLVKVDLKERGLHRARFVGAGSGTEEDAPWLSDLKSEAKRS